MLRVKHLYVNGYLYVAGNAWTWMSRRMFTLFGRCELRTWTVPIGVVMGLYFHNFVCIESVEGGLISHPSGPNMASNGPNKR